MRERDPVRAQEGLRAIVDQLGRTRRLTEQLLSLAHASQADAPPRQELDLNDVARDVVLQYLPLAHEKQQDLGWVDARGDEAEGASDTAVVPVWGSEVELHEALSNLVHNAINYTLAGRASRYRSCATPAAPRQVADDGPGIEPLLRARAFAGSTAWRATAMRRRRDRGWGCRSPVPMRGATMAISNCATASPTPRAGSDCAPCSWIPCTTRARRPTRPRRSGAAAERLASNASPRTPRRHARRFSAVILMSWLRSAPVPHQGHLCRQAGRRLGAVAGGKPVHLADPAFDPGAVQCIQFWLVASMRLQVGRQAVELAFVAAGLGVMVELAGA